MTDRRKLAIMAAAMQRAPVFGFDFDAGPSLQSHWPMSLEAKNKIYSLKKGDKRAKIKAARKQRRKSK